LARFGLRLVTPSLKNIAERVRRDVEGYLPPDPNPQQLGTPLSQDWFDKELTEMRSLLLSEPYFLEVPAEHSDELRRVVIVAEDEWALLAWDPDPEGDFVLIFRSAPKPGLSNIRGDAVGCFLAR
jgi:hypothetical protein